MKRGWLVMVLGVAACGLAGCDEKQRMAYYDPEIDGVLPHPDRGIELTILENQQRLYQAFLAAGGSAPKAAPAAPGAPGAAPAAAPGATPGAAPGAAPATPGPEAPAAPAAPTAPPPPPPPAETPPAEGAAPPPPG
jgi:hypothetical protein